MLKVGVLLCLAETGSPLGLVLVAFLIRVGIGLGLPRSLVFLYPLCLALLVCGGFSLSLGLGLRGLGGLFALYFGIFGSIPGVEDLVQSVIS